MSCSGFVLLFFHAVVAAAIAYHLVDRNEKENVKFQQPLAAVCYGGQSR